MTLILRTLVTFLAMGFSALPIAAQTQIPLGQIEDAEAQSQPDPQEAAFVDAFSGAWFVFDDTMGQGDQTCALTLGTDAASGLGTAPEGSTMRRAAVAQNCVAPLNGVAAWDIFAGQMRLFAVTGEPVATLGGNQRRVTGEIDNTERGLIVERASGSEMAPLIAQAVARHRCIYRGFTQDCAAPEDLRKPAITEEGGTFGSVGLLVNLNVRDQPRSGATILGTLKTGTCLKVNFCASASDGIWCRARFGERTGWVPKTAIRQSEWPVLTYANSCAATDAEAPAE